jgi:hypothetical protein
MTPDIVRAGYFGPDCPHVHRRIDFAAHRDRSLRSARSRR